MHILRTDTRVSVCVCVCECVEMIILLFYSETNDHIFLSVEKEQKIIAQTSSQKVGTHSVNKHKMVIQIK